VASPLRTRTAELLKNPTISLDQQANDVVGLRARQSQRGNAKTELESRPFKLIDIWVKPSCVISTQQNIWQLALHYFACEFGIKIKIKCLIIVNYDKADSNASCPKTSVPNAILIVSKLPAENVEQTCSGIRNRAIKGLCTNRFTLCGVVLTKVAIECSGLVCEL
jgi:hypothetical protein